MALEDLTGDKYINSLVSTNPVGTVDKVKTLDDHIKGIKNVLLKSFPAVTGPVTATNAELSKLAGVTATPTEFNKLAGLTVTTTELNYVTGVTSAIQTQLNSKAAHAIVLTAGNGLTGGGDLSANRTFTIGTPGDVTSSSTSAVTATSHTHALAANAVTTAKIADLNVTEGKLATGAVTEGKIGTGAVTNAKLATNAVSTVKILDGNVTTDKLADANVTTAKLESGEQMTTTNVLAKTAGATAGAIGTYAFASSASDAAFGATRAGAALFPTSAARAVQNTDFSTLVFGAGTALSGTWRAMGTYDYEATGSGTNELIGATLWLRIL